MPKAKSIQAGTTKQDLVREMLSRDSGATLDDLVAATGWKPHSIRAALTTLRKSGLRIDKEKTDGVTRYSSARAD